LASLGTCPAYRPDSTFGTVGELQHDPRQGSDFLTGIQQFHKFATTVAAVRVREEFVDDQRRPQGMREENDGQGTHPPKTQMKASTAPQDGLRRPAGEIQGNHTIREERRKGPGRQGGG